MNLKDQYTKEVSCWGIHILELKNSFWIM